jgi:hypothetical protein
MASKNLIRDLLRLVALGLLAVVFALPVSAADADDPGEPLDALEQKYVDRLIDAIRRDDRGTVASMLAYPFRVKFANGRSVKLNTPKDLHAEYTKIFNEGLKKAVYGGAQPWIWKTYRGICLGQGHIWIVAFIIDGKDDIQIVAINPDAPAV